MSVQKRRKYREYNNFKCSRLDLHDCPEEDIAGLPSNIKEPESYSYQHGEPMFN